MFDIRQRKIGEDFQEACYATQFIPEGTLIHEFCGLVLSKEDTVKDIELGLIRSGDDPLQVGEDAFLSLVPPGLYFNHSCEPNAMLAGHANLVAFRDILKGEEVTYDYSLNVTPNNPWIMSFLCECKSPVCRLTIGSITSIPRQTLSQYFQKRGIQDFMRKYVSQSQLNSL